VAESITRLNVQPLNNVNFSLTERLPGNAQMERRFPNET
jgi:hypothetical protein